ncbi:MAG: hypothetical protein J6W00_12595, partial [Lentisphaeria bacterium]|nr:hypothetical protein [Lentisphaeria bacterium]
MCSAKNSRQGDSKDFLTNYIKDSWNSLDTILKEYCSLVEDKQMRLFNDQRHAATTNQNLIADAAAYTTPELQQDKQAYKRHKLAEEALWLWCVVYCMRQMWVRCIKSGYVPVHTEEKPLTDEEIQIQKKFREATWDGVVEGVTYSLDHIRKDIVEHFGDEKTRDKKYVPKKGYNLKNYVLNMARNRTLNKYDKIYDDNQFLACPTKSAEKDKEEDWIDTLTDPLAETPMDRDDKEYHKEFLKIFRDGYEQLERDSDMHIEEIKSASSIDWLADYIENNR